MTRGARTGLVVGAAALVVGVLVGVAVHDSTTTGHSARTATNAENAAFWYEPLHSDDVSKIGHPRVVVLSRQDDERNAVRLVHDVGAEAFHYFQAVWLPAGKPLEGIDLAEHPDWALCISGSTPATGRTIDTPWYYVDTNERAAHDALVDQLRRIRADGYDGVFFDLGYAALNSGRTPDGHELPSLRSSCTDQPVRAGATVADGYVALLAAARQIRLKVFLNFPDPHGARPLRADVDQLTDLVLDEMSNASLDPSTFATVLAANQRDLADGRVIAYVKTATHTQEQAVHDIGLAWARAKLAGNVSIATDSGDDNCHGIDPGGSDTCHRHGVFPELVDTHLGAAVDAQPMRIGCDTGAPDACLFVRRYTGGLVAANISATTRAIGPLDLGVTGCRSVTDVLANAAVGDGRCVTTIDVPVAASAGLVLRYST